MFGKAGGLKNVTERTGDVRTGEVRQVGFGVERWCLLKCGKAGEDG